MVSLTDLNEKKNINIEVAREDVNIRAKNFQLYHRYIFATLKDVFGVRVITFHRSFCFVGEATDVAICKVLFPWMEDVFWTTYYAYFKRTGRHVSANKRGIYSGLWMGIVKANKQEEAKASAQEQACLGLVLRSKETAIASQLAVMFPELKHTKARACQTNDYAFQEGFSKGSKINLAQVGSSQVTSQLQ